VLGGEGGKGKIFWCRSVQREGNIRTVCVGPDAKGGKGKYFCPGRCSVVTQREGGREGGKKLQRFPGLSVFPTKRDVLVGNKIFPYD
jgi:hypothetical protein